MPLAGAEFARASFRTPPDRSTGGSKSGRSGRAARRGDLHRRIASLVPGEELREHVFAEGEIGGGDDGPYRQDHQRTGDDPERDRSKPHLARRTGVVRPRRPPARVLRSAAIIAVLWRRPTKHSRIPAACLAHASYARASSRLFNAARLIFQESHVTE